MQPALPKLPPSLPSGDVDLAASDAQTLVASTPADVEVARSNPMTTLPADALSPSLLRVGRVTDLPTASAQSVTDLPKRRRRSRAELLVLPYSPVKHRLRSRCTEKIISE